MLGVDLAVIVNPAADDKRPFEDRNFGAVGGVRQQANF